jgi:ribosomal-protein-alanine N-acetyltransferase
LPKGLLKDDRTIIRRANVDDIPYLIAMERECSTAAHWSEQQYQNVFLASAEPLSRLALVAEEGEPSTILGFLVARNLPPEWELENIVVAPSARRRGIGKQLMEALLTQATQANSRAVFLEVRESNTTARRLYESMGLAETGRRAGYYNSPKEDAILYSKVFQSAISG